MLKVNNAKKNRRPQKRDDWWEKAPDLVRVDIATGEIKVFRWPIYERYTHEYPKDFEKG